MKDDGTDGGPAAMVERLRLAANEHDLDALVGCFASDYRNETPAHPERGFTGRDQVAKNWTQIFSAIRDVRADVLRCVVDGDTVWSEWEHRGTRPDGTAHIMRGVIVFAVGGGVIASARFYLEPVDVGDRDVDAAVQAQVSPGTTA